MKIAEHVTFGAGLLNRSAHERPDADQLDKRAETSRILPVWRGKPLVTQTPSAVTLCMLDLAHPELSEHRQTLVYLGRDTAGAIFAADVSGWCPPEGMPDRNVFLDQTRQSFPGTDENTAFVELRGIMALLSPRDAEIAATARAILEWHRIHGFCANCGVKTDAINGGWQRNCEACGRMHFPRTDPVVIMLITYGNAVLLGRGKDWPEGMFSLLAGFMEPGETIEAATRREVLEETQVQVGEVGYLASQPWPYPSSLMIGTWGKALSTEIELDPAELEDARWITREDMLEVFAGRIPSISPAREGSIANFLLKNWLADRLD